MANCAASPISCVCSPRASTAGSYVKPRLDASRRVGEFQLYARLFSLWHALHVPLFIMLLIAGGVHVISSEVIDHAHRACRVFYRFFLIFKVSGDWKHSGY